MTKTYKGKTGGGLLKQARIANTYAGAVEVFVGECIASLTDYRSMILSDAAGVVAHVSLSSRAADRLERMLAKADKMMLDAHQ